MAGPSTTFSKLEISTRIPAGYKAIPIDRAGSQAVVRLCLLAAAAPEPGVNPLIHLRSSVDAAHYLGCLVDNAGRWLEWVDIAVQQVEGMQNTPAAFREMLNNHILDTRWAQRATLIRELQPDEVILTGFESINPPCMYLDLAASRFVTAEDDNSGETWKLCRDDDVLEQADLPDYRASLARYLYSASAGADGGMVPLTKSSPLNENTIELSEVMPKVQSLKAFNAYCGLLEARRFHPLSYEDYVDLLSGRPWAGLRPAGRLLNVDESWPGFGDLAQSNPLQNQTFFGRAGLRMQLAEVFHLKLALFTQVMRMVRQVVRRTQLPLLNLSGDSFRVRFESRSGALPLFWTAKCCFSTPGQAVALRVRNIGQRFFIRLGGPAHSIYQPNKVGQVVSGASEVRIRGLSKENNDTVVRGTLSLRQPLLVSSTDILWLRLELASGSQNFYGHLFPEEALSRLDMPFRTWPVALEEEDVQSLQAAAEQFALPEVPFEVIPMLSSPVDLHSLGVLAVRTFLVNEAQGFPDAVADMLSLAREMAARHDPELPLAERAMALISSSPNWLKQFGPHNVFSHAMDPAQAFEVIPPSHWYELLSVILSMFPGMGPDSVAAEFGTTPGGLETVFDEPLARFERLAALARDRIIPPTPGGSAPVPTAAHDTTAYGNQE